MSKILKGGTSGGRLVNSKKPKQMRRGGPSGIRRPAPIPRGPRQCTEEGWLIAWYGGFCENVDDCNQICANECGGPTCYDPNYPNMQCNLQSGPQEGICLCLCLPS
jgi:hypothetical protein